MINDASIAGLGFGSFFAGKIVQRGRLKTALFANFLIILGCLPQMVLSLWLIFFGRLVVGFGCGLLLVATSIYVKETLPAKSIEPCLTSLNLGITYGIVIITMIQVYCFKGMDY